MVGRRPDTQTRDSSGEPVSVVVVTVPQVSPLLSHRHGRHGEHRAPPRPGGDPQKHGGSPDVWCSHRAPPRRGGGLRHEGRGAHRAPPQPGGDHQKHGGLPDVWCSHRAPPRRGGGLRHDSRLEHHAPEPGWGGTTGIWTSASGPEQPRYSPPRGRRSVPNTPIRCGPRSQIRGR